MHCPETACAENSYVDITRLEREVWRGPVAEFDNLNIQTLRLDFRDQCLDRLGVDIGNHADLHGFRPGELIREQKDSGNQNGKTEFRRALRRQYISSIYYTKFIDNARAEKTSATQDHRRRRA